MRIVVGAADVAATRFAVSPVWEAVTLLRRALRGPSADELARDVGLRALAFLNGPRQGASFAAPPPRGMAQTIDDDLAAIAATPPALARAEVDATVRLRRPDREVAELLARPDVVAAVVDGAQAAWHRLLAADWPRVRVVLERDVRFRTARLAEEGWSGVVAGMHPRLHWERDAITVDGADGDDLDTAGQGLLLIPSVHIDGGIAVHDEAPWHPSVIYPARGSGLLLEPTGRVGGPLGPLLGRARAELLEALAVPSSTSQLATLTGATVGATGDHLKVLREAGLVVRERQGRSVIYARTALGDALAGGPRPS